MALLAPKIGSTAIAQRLLRIGKKLAQCAGSSQARNTQGPRAVRHRSSLPCESGVG